MKMILQIGILSLFYIAGVWIEQLFNLVIPGSIIGMVLLFLALLSKKFKVEWIKEGASVLVNHMTLLFIPITLGIINYLHFFKGKELLLIPIGLIATLIVMLVAGWVSQYLGIRSEKQYE